MKFEEGFKISSITDKEYNWKVDLLLAALLYPRVGILSMA